MKRLSHPIYSLLFLFLFAACSDEDEEKTAFIPEQSRTVYENVSETISQDKRLDSLETALLYVDLFQKLQNKGPFTFFAPTNAAFKQLLDSNTNWSKIRDIDSSFLRQTILYHIAGALIASSHLEEDSYISSLNSQGANNESTSLEIDVLTGVSLNNFAQVISPNHFASNGNIHLIDQVLRPLSVLELLESDERFSSFLFPLSQAFKDSLAGLDSLAKKKPFTLFVPTDSAFIRLLESNSSWNSLSDIPNLESIVKYHIVAGQNYRAANLSKGQILTSLNQNTFQVDSNDASQLITADTNQAKVNIRMINIQGTNGVIHVIEEVMKE